MLLPPTKLDKGGGGDQTNKAVCHKGDPAQ